MNAWDAFWKGFLHPFDLGPTGDINPVTGEKMVPTKLPIISDIADGAKVVVTDIKDALSGVGGVFKNLPTYLFVIIAFLGVYLLLMGNKGKKVI